MKKIITTVILSFAFICCYAQQEHQYTQFMFNKLGHNPGYAGSKDAACLTGIYRSQWMGLEGAPNSQLLSFNMPLLNKRIGIGLNLSRSSIGISERWTVDGIYSYRVNLGRGTLGLGIQGSIRYIGNDYTDPRLQATQGITADGGIPVGEKNKYVPNFGVGLYYSTSTFYFGIAAPRLLKNNIDFNDISGILSKEVQHWNVMAGVLFQLSESVDLQPQGLIKYASGAPLDAELNLSLIFVKKYTAGLTYRVGGNSGGSGSSIDLLVAAHLTDELLFGASYDIPLSDLKDYNNGSIEVLLRYCFGTSEGEEFINPRFF